MKFIKMLDLIHSVDLGCLASFQASHNCLNGLHTFSRYKCLNVGLAFPEIKHV